MRAGEAEARKKSRNFYTMYPSMTRNKMIDSVSLEDGKTDRIVDEIDKTIIAVFTA